MSKSGLAATLRDGASNWTAILASLTTASNYGFVRDFAVVWLYLGTILWYGCITSSHVSWEHCGGPSSKSVFVFYHDAFEVDVYSTRRLPLLGSPPLLVLFSAVLFQVAFNFRDVRTCAVLSLFFVFPGIGHFGGIAVWTPLGTTVVTLPRALSRNSAPCLVMFEIGLAGRSDVFPVHG